jgi:TRAP-type mannitol/chloroaromatic compound transport system permease small subunit
MAAQAPIDETLPHRQYLPHTRASLRISRALQWIGRVTAWVWLVLLGVIVTNVVMRYVFGEGRIEFEELQWHLYAIGFLLGLSVCLDSDDHIRVDIFHDRLSARSRAWIELYGLLLLFLPFVMLVLVFAVPFVAAAFELGEVSDAPGGLPYRWLIKASLPLAFVLLLAAGCGRLLRVAALLFGAPRAVDGSPHVDE